jgi:hypothetical protein
MSDEQIPVEHVPQLRSVGRKRTRPLGDPTRLIRALQEQNEQLKEQNDKIMALLADKAESPISIFPAAPEKVARPEGIAVEFKLKNQDHKTGDPYFAHEKIFPSRADNPNMLDPRVCVFCGKNVNEIYETPMTSAPDEAEILELKKLHRMHLSEMQSFKSSDKKKEKRIYADHFELNARIVGRVPDIVKHLKGKDYSSEEENAIRLKQWKVDCARIAQNPRG